VDNNYYEDGHDMKTIDIAFVRLLQFLVLLFFTFIVFLWYGCASLIPLALWVNLTEFFSGAFGAIFSTIMALAIIIALGVYLSKIPKLIETFLATGVDLIKLGNTSIQRLGSIAGSIRNNATPHEQKVEITLKDECTE
jgi:hypothetical protein